MAQSGDNRGGQNKISRDSLLRELRDVAEKVDGSPTQAQMREHGEYSIGAYYTEFGSWNEAKEAADLEILRETEAETVRLNCSNCGDELVRRKSQIKNQEHVYCDRDCKHEHQSTRYSGEGNPRFNENIVTCDWCGEEFHRAPWKADRHDRQFCSMDCYSEYRSEVIVGDNHPRYDKVESECEQCGGTFETKTSLADERRFCSWECSNEWKSELFAESDNPNWKGGTVTLTCNYCKKEFESKAAVAEKRLYCSYSCHAKDRTGEDHPRWRGGYEPYYGPNWRRQRRRAIVRDQARCQDCGVSEAAHVELHGEELSVHHLTPFREFVDGDDVDLVAANALANLVTLCRECHADREAEG